jgi:lysophospholipase L1-like esterase
VPPVGRVELVLHAALRPVMRLWRLGILDAWGNSPCALDPPYEYVAGPDPVRVLLLGGNAVAGFGVLTHQLGLVGQVCRQLAEATGRGVEVEACAQVGMTIDELLVRVQSLPRVRTGLVVIALGVNDILRLTALQVWKRDLQRLFDLIREDAAENVQIIVVEAPPMDKLHGSAWLPSRITRWQSRLLNDSTRVVCDDLDYVTLVPFPEDEQEDVIEMVGGNAETYRAWAAKLTVHLENAALRTREQRLPNAPGDMAQGGVG